MMSCETLHNRPHGTCNNNCDVEAIKANWTHKNFCGFQSQVRGVGGGGGVA